MLLIGATSSSLDGKNTKHYGQCEQLDECIDKSTSVGGYTMRCTATMIAH